MPLINVWEKSGYVMDMPCYAAADPSMIKIWCGGKCYRIKPQADGLEIMGDGQMEIQPVAANMIKIVDKGFGGS